MADSNDIRRYSSRTHRLDETVLHRELEGARRYDRIAGYFTSSLFEVAGESLERVGQVRIVCNSDVAPEDLRVARNRESALLGRLSEDPGVESLLNRRRYAMLDTFLEAHPDAIRVVPDGVSGFVHGKAGLIERGDGNRVGFIGSMNESRNGWQRHYEILWADESTEGTDWIQAEFDWLWERAHPLPRVVLQEIQRRAHRAEITVDSVEDPAAIGPAAVAESPMYREGFSLSPWQRAFVREALKHREWYGAVRLLVADEVGLGKTLSLATATIVLALLAEKESRAGRKPKPIAIFAPATLTEQWQIELIDKLGIPVARWRSFDKVWLDPEGHVISPKGAREVARCPYRIGVISTGLLQQPTQEREELADIEFETLVLDESHKARERQGVGPSAGEANVLMNQITHFARNATHVLLGTATPMQTEISDLWSQLRVLQQGKGHFVLGSDFAPWHQPDRVIPLLTGEQTVRDPDQAWEYLRSPIPPTDISEVGSFRRMIQKIRRDLGMKDREFEQPPHTDRTHLDRDTREAIEDELDRTIQGTKFFQRHNPIVRHVVLRKRQDLEEKGLLQRVGVLLHPDRDRMKDGHLYAAMFEGKALRTGPAFDSAYQAANDFGSAYGRRKQAAGFMTNLMRQRLCSSPRAAENTASKILEGSAIEDETGDPVDLEEAPSEAEIDALQRLIEEVGRLRGEDPKVRAIRHYLIDEQWADLGCIIFSQYYDTAYWVARQVAPLFPDEAIGVYAGAGKSMLLRGQDSATADREHLKALVKNRQIRLMVATDAACEGLNLQTLGALINVDLPWNPVKLEQRIGRIKRFGQARDNVDMLNLVYQDTVDDTIYERLSERMQDRYDLFGSLPDTIEDEWIDDETLLAKEMDRHIENRKRLNGFDLRYSEGVLDEGSDPWRDCTTVFAQSEIDSIMRKGWR